MGGTLSEKRSVSVEYGADVGNVFVDENLLKVVNVEEIFQRVILGATHIALIDHLEDDVAEVIGGVDAPAGEDERAQHTEGLEPQSADTFQQFGAGDMACLFRAGIATQLLLSISEGRIDETECDGRIVA